jgi:hypothetical protein
LFNNFGSNCLTSFSVKFTSGTAGSIIVLSTVYTVEVLAKYPSNATISGQAYGTSAYVDFGSGNPISKIDRITIILLL